MQRKLTIVLDGDPTAKPGDTKGVKLVIHHEPPLKPEDIALLSTQPSDFALFGAILLAACDAIAKCSTTKHSIGGSVNPDTGQLEYKVNVGELGNSHDALADKAILDAMYNHPANPDDDLHNIRRRRNDQPPAA
jgi:hypothetical protein